MSNKNESHENHRKLVVQWIFFIYVLFLITGSLRKWVLPRLATPLIFLSDPFVIILYVYCIYHKLIMHSGLASIWLRFAAFTTFFGLIQYSISGFSLEGWLLGVRAYWLYMPLAFIVARTFSSEDVMRLFKLNLWLAIPYAILVSFQYRASPFAFINRGVGGDEEVAVGVALGIFRPFGLFTYPSPNVMFTAAMVAIFIAVYLSDKKEHPHPIVFSVMAVAVTTMAVLTGSRAIFFLIAIILGLTILGLTLTRLNGKILVRIFFMLGFVALAYLLLVNVFPDMFIALGARFESASTAEGSIWKRVYFETLSFLYAFDTAPIQGHGIGAGASGVARFLGLQNLALGESDTNRNINELGLILGPTFLLIRWFTSLWVIANAIKLARKGKPLVLPLAGFIVFIFSVGQMTFSPIISFFPWLILGIFLTFQNMTSKTSNNFG